MISACKKLFAEHGAGRIATQRSGAHATSNPPFSTCCTKCCIVLAMTPAAAKNRARAVHTVTAAEAKAQLSALLKRVLNGERITITHYNRPVADLVPTTIGER